MTSCSGINADVAVVKGLVIVEDDDDFEDVSVVVEVVVEVVVVEVVVVVVVGLGVVMGILTGVVDFVDESLVTKIGFRGNSELVTV